MLGQRLRRRYNMEKALPQRSRVCWAEWSLPGRVINDCSAVHFPPLKTEMP